MTSLSIPLRGTRTLSPTVAFGLLASILVMLLASSSAPTPLYATYQAQWGFSAITITVVFGVYAVAVLLSLPVFGALSDHVGRRPVLVTAIRCMSITPTRAGRPTAYPVWGLRSARRTLQPACRILLRRIWR